MSFCGFSRTWLYKVTLYWPGVAAVLEPRTSPIRYRNSTIRHDTSRPHLPNTVHMHTVHHPSTSTAPHLLLLRIQPPHNSLLSCRPRTLSATLRHATRACARPSETAGTAAPGGNALPALSRDALEMLPARLRLARPAWDALGRTLARVGSRAFSYASVRRAVHSRERRSGVATPRSEPSWRSAARRCRRCAHLEARGPLRGRPPRLEYLPFLSACVPPNSLSRFFRCPFRGDSPCPVRSLTGLFLLLDRSWRVRGPVCRRAVQVQVRRRRSAPRRSSPRAHIRTCTRTCTRARTQAQARAPALHTLGSPRAVLGG